jgi:uncharacterized membrane protein
MIDRVLVVVTFVSAIGCGLVAGVFYAFSTFVMKALVRVPTAAGISAMQSINVVVINPLFLGVFLGTAVLCLLAIVGAVIRWERPGAGWSTAGGVLYLAGAFLITMFGNVPLNNSLARLAIDAPDTEQRWADYVAKWTIWNHFRTIAATLAMALFMISLRWR